MIFTIDQFKSQEEFWEDKWNFFAIHKTCGGAVYLLRVEKDYPTQKIDDKPWINAEAIRVDGVDYKTFYEHIKDYI